MVLLRMEGVLRHFAGCETELIFELQEELPRCVIDHTQFDAALMNLVSNSRQAMTDGGKNHPLKLSSTIRQPGRHTLRSRSATPALVSTMPP